MAHFLEFLDNGIPFLFTAKVDGSVLFVKIHQTRKRAIVRLTLRGPRQVLFRAEMLFFQPGPQPFKGRIPSDRVRSGYQINRLGTAKRTPDIAFLNQDRKDRDRHRLGIAQLHKAPL